MLCAVFLGGPPFLLDGASSSSSSESASDFRLRELDGAGSGDECDEVELERPLFIELGLLSRLGVESGGGGAAKLD